MIIGDKDKFACQVGSMYSVVPKYSDCFILWCGGQFIGEPENWDIINMYSDPLLKAYQNRMALTPPNDLFLEPDEFFSQGLDELDDYYDYSVPRLPQFDAFHIYLFYEDGRFHYLWRIAHEYEWVTSCLPNYPRGCFSYTIPEDEFLAVAVKVKEVIDKIEEPKRGLTMD